MTTREVYFKNLYEACGMPVGLAGYVYFEPVSNSIRLGHSIELRYSTDEDIVLGEIEKIEKVQNVNGFMFWAVESECKALLKQITWNFDRI